MNNLAPIVLFVYNRPWHTLQTLEALANNQLAKDSVLYIYADGAKNDATEDTISKIKETRNTIKQKQWCGEVHIIESDKNKGLAKSIREGINDIITKHEKVIVLEDDIVTSSGFLSYMNNALTLYENKDKVMHISGFVPVTTGGSQLPETYFLRFMSCWGWATWKRAWDKFIDDIDYLYTTLPEQPDYEEFNLSGAIDMFWQIRDNYNGTINTWAIKWYSTIFLHKGLCLYPHQSLVDNIGIDGSGENCFNNDNRYEVVLLPSINVKPIEIKENKKAKKYLMRFYIYGNDSSLMHRTILYLKKTWLYPVYKKIRK